MFNFRLKYNNLFTINKFLGKTQPIDPDNLLVYWGSRSSPSSKPSQLQMLRNTMPVADFVDGTRLIANKGSRSFIIAYPKNSITISAVNQFIVSDRTYVTDENGNVLTDENDNVLFDTNLNDVFTIEITEVFVEKELVFTDPSTVPYTVLEFFPIEHYPVFSEYEFNVTILP